MTVGTGARSPRDKHHCATSCRKSGAGTLGGAAAGVAEDARAEVDGVEVEEEPSSKGGNIGSDEGASDATSTRAAEAET